MKQVSEVKEKIFLSAVTSQFRECRDALRSDLAAVGAAVVVQEDFQQHGGPLLHKLEEYIASCDRVIALVGSAYGWEPVSAAIREDAPTRSYNQWEYHFARGERLDGTQTTAKPLYVYFATPAYLEQHPVEQSAADAQRQRQFIDDIESSSKDRNAFNSTDELARLVVRDGFRLSSASELLRQNLPYDSLGPLFKGRDGCVTAIRDQLSAGAEEAIAIVAKQAIPGLGGVGKTRVAVEYAWQWLAAYSACLFVTADSPANLARNLGGLCSAKVLNLPEGKVQEQEEQVAAVLRWLNHNPGWLLILGNVDTSEAAAAVKRVLPALQNGHVLITSRRTDWGNSIRTLALDTLNEGDAVAFLLEKTKDRTATADDEAAACTLVRTLDGLALALEQAGAFINQKRISLEAYQQRWAQQEAELRHWQDDRAMNYLQSLAVIWETSFNQLSPAAQALLNVLSWFATEPIPRETFGVVFGAETLKALLGDSETENAGATQLLDLEDLLDELESLSLIKSQTGNRGFSIHRVVRAITQARLGEDARKQALRAAVGLINQALPSDPPFDDIRARTVWDPLRPHVEHLIHAADAAGIADPTARLMNDLGQYLETKGLLPEAEALYRRALALDEARFGKAHPCVGVRLNNLALLLRATNRPAEAEPLMRRALSIDEANFGREHPNVAIRLSNLAQLLQGTNRLEEAERLMRRALSIDEASFGNGHPDVARDLNDLAQLLQTTYRLSEAEPLMRRSLAIDEANFGSRHPKVAIRLNNLAQLLQATNRPEEAELLYRRALEIDKARFGSEHPDVATDLKNLAQLLQTTNRFAEAEPLSRERLELFLVFTIRTGYEHPNLSAGLRDYKGLLAAMGRDEQEQQLEIEALIESAKRKASA